MSTGAREKDLLTWGRAFYFFQFFLEVKNWPLTPDVFHAILARQAVRELGFALRPCLGPRLTLVSSP